MHNIEQTWISQSVESTPKSIETISEPSFLIQGTVYTVSALTALILLSDPSQAASIKDILPKEVVDWIEFVEDAFRNHPIIAATWTTASGYLLNELRHRIGLYYLGHKVSRENVQSSYTTFDIDGNMMTEEESGRHINFIFPKGTPEFKLLVEATKKATNNDFIISIWGAVEEVVVSRVHSETISSLSGHAGENSARAVLWEKWIQVPFVWVLTFEPRYHQETGKVFDKSTDDKMKSTKQQIRYIVFPKAQFDQITDFLQGIATQEGISFEEILNKISENDSIYSDDKIEKILSILTKKAGASVDDLLQSGKLKRNVDRKRILVLVQAIRHEKRWGYLKKFDLRVHK